MGAGIVFGVYRRPDLAFQHARCITGTTVAVVDLDDIPPPLQAIISMEILDELPVEILDDLEVEWEHDDSITPIMEIPLDEIDES